MLLQTINGLRILTLSDIQGNFDVLTKLYHEYQPIDLIIHTGNFGFWDLNTIHEYKELNYFKQIVAFLEVLETELIEQLNNLSKISNSGNADEISIFKTKLLSSTSSISQFQQYVNGEKSFPCPVYTIFGPLDDPKIIDKLQTKQVVIPNLHLIDHKNNYEIKTAANVPNIKLYGLGGTLKIHSLFDNGNLNYLGISGKLGELWISLLQIAELYISVTNSKNFADTTKNSTINIFVSHIPVVKAPLLEHLAIITHADFTISQGLHFRYPVMGNGMSFVDSMGGSAGYVENYRSKFSRLRMILGELWLVLKGDLLELLLNSDSSESLKNLIELGLSLFDKIPVSVNDSLDKIVPLSLFPEENQELNKKLLKRINDYYFQAYYNLWHFNLCDHSVGADNKHNVMIFKLDNAGNFNLDYCSSQGFNFNFKLQDPESDTNGKEEGSHHDEDLEDLIRQSHKTYRGPSRRGGGGGGGSGNSRGRGGTRGNGRGTFYRGRRGGGSSRPSR
ncbi:Uncharacterized protein C16H5.12c [Candida viswanathii]|uniref:Uncharacterized protein C16H5.12c n=1 Tax=Candida viswanathii TaxID=5486 RepID=A0A367YPE3_9ASCO|nr:Uncharacterized protein C16H5.12c [Candida viswanathii]